MKQPMYYFIYISLFILDRMGKLITLMYGLGINKSIFAGKGFLYWILFYNKGCTTGFFGSSTATIHTALALFFLLFLLWKLKKKNTYILNGLSLLFIGAASAFMDRLVYGGVIDYIGFKLNTGLARWLSLEAIGVNLSDIYIITGAILFYIGLRKLRKIQGYVFKIGQKEFN